MEIDFNQSLLEDNLPLLREVLMEFEKQKNLNVLYVPESLRSSSCEPDSETEIYLSQWAKAQQSKVYLHLAHKCFRAFNNEYQTYNPFVPMGPPIPLDFVCRVGSKMWSVCKQVFPSHVLLRQLASYVFLSKSIGVVITHSLDVKNVTTSAVWSSHDLTSGWWSQKKMVRWGLYG